MSFSQQLVQSFCESMEHCTTHSRTHGRQPAGTKRGDEEEGGEREGRDIERLRESWCHPFGYVCPGVGAFQGVCVQWSGMWTCCFVSLIPPARATLARAHYHPMTQSVCQDTPHTYYTFITPRHDRPVPPVEQPFTYPHQPLLHRCSLSNIQCQQLQCQEGQFVCFQWPLRIKRGIWTNSPLGQRGWNNHHTLHGGNHLMLKPLDPLIPEAKLSHTVITSAPFLLLDLQCVCVCVCVKWSSLKSFTFYRQ